MTARPERLLACSYELETNWAEATDTWGTRLQLVGLPTLSLTQDRTAEAITQQYREEGKAGVLGVRGGEMTVTLALTGYGATTASGGLTATDLATIMANAMGDISTSNQGRAITSVTSASQFAPTGGTFENGALIRVGALGDGRANGQWAAVNNGTTATVLTALPAAPTTADTLFGALLVYPWEDAGGMPIASSRWLVQTANKHYKLRGVFPKSFSVQGVNTGEMPTISITYGISWWDYANETFPSVTATDAKDGSICGNGSAWINDVGTTTNATYSMRSWSVNFDMQVAVLEGPDAVNPEQSIVGAVRTRCAATATTMFDAEATGTETWGDKFDAGTLQHILIGLSVADGKSIAFYFPNAELVSRPTQEGSDGLNRVTCNWRALTGPTLTNGRTHSSFRIGMA